MKTDSLKKHHFWILLMVSFLFVGLSLIFLMTKVSGAIEAGLKENDDQVKKVTSTSPPGKGVIEGIEAQKAQLDKKKDELWRENASLQEKFFTWPKHNQNLFVKYDKMKFGADIDQIYTDYEHDQMQLKSVYQAAYEEAASRIEPTRFAGPTGSWHGILRWVRDWGQRKAQSRQMWLLMEDLWVQRSLLDPIAEVNKSIARFDHVKNAEDKPLKKTFQSRVWELQLEVVPGGPTGRQIKYVLKNRTAQLQMLGTGNTMFVNIWLDPKVQVPFPLPIQGAFIPGYGQYPAPEKDAQGRERPAEPVTVPITPGISVTDIVRVEQVLDRLSVPIRTLDQLYLGFVSDKYAVLMAKESKQLEPPKFWAEDPNAIGAGGFGVDGGVPGMEGGLPGGPAGVGAGPGGLPGMDAGGPGPGGVGPGGMMGGTGASMGPIAGATTLIGAADANRKRYILVNDQIRRMPVAFTLTCDQMYIQDVLIAFANSPMRFEAVQYHWRRLNRAPGGAGLPGTGGGMMPGGSGLPGEDYGGMIGGYASGGLSAGFAPPGGMPGGMPGDAGMGMAGGLPGMGSPGGMPGGLPETGFGGKEGMGMGSPFGMGGAMGSFGGGFGGFGGSLFSTISDAQANAGLVELSVYGIVSIYERYQEKTDDQAAPADAGNPAEAAPGAN